MLMPTAVARSAGTQSIPRSRVVLRSAEDRHDLRYYVYCPQQLNRELPIFVPIHGISINAREQARLFSGLAEAAGVLLVAPLFDPQYYGDYQRLGRPGRGARADDALERMLDDVEQDTGHTPGPICLFGFSGGGQFAHRFAMSRPHRVSAQVLSAPGWFTFPDPARRYPYGVKSGRQLPEVTFDADQFLRIDTAVFVGSRDTVRDRSLRTTSRVDKQQGRTRVERGHRWLTTMCRQARQRGYETRFEFGLLEQCGHNFKKSIERGDLGTKTFQFLFKQFGRSEAVLNQIGKRG